MADVDLTPPAKRNVKALSALLTELEPDDAMVATFATDRYGVFVVRGRLVHSQSLGAFTLGSQPLDANKKPQKALQLLRIFPAAEQSAADAELHSAGPAAAGTVAHGDLVRAWISEPAYGDFEITGVAVASSVDDSLLVGGWIVEARGAVAPRVRGLQRRAEAGSHELAVPRPITTWGGEAAVEV